MNLATGITLHGVLASGDAGPALARLEELGHADVQIIEAGPLAAAVSVISAATPSSQATPEAEQTESERAAALALRHHAVLSTVIAVADVVPVRLGSLFSTREAAADLMMREQARFSSELFRLKSCVEMGFRVTVPEIPLLPVKAIKAQHPEAGQGYLRRQAAARMSSTAEHQAQAAAAHAAIEAFIPFAVDILPRPARPRKGERRVLSDIAVLVKRDAVHRFTDLARTHEESLSERGLVVSVLGPWPAYSFVQSQTQGALSWAAH